MEVVFGGLGFKGYTEKVSRKGCVVPGMVNPVSMNAMNNHVHMSSAKGTAYKQLLCEGRRLTRGLQAQKT